MWIPFRKNKKESLKNCLEMSKKTLLDLQVTLKSDENPVKIISEARIKVGRSLIAINKILDKLK